MITVLQKWLPALALYALLSHAGVTFKGSPAEILPRRDPPGSAAPTQSAIASDGQAATIIQRAVDHIRGVIADIIRTSYPELANISIEVKPFVSRSDYFQSRFSVGAYLTPSMHYIVRVNPAIEDRHCPDAAIRAIVAHELAHILSFKQRNRLALLGLVRLASGSYTRDFERRTDLIAISRGYGEGLKAYRRWLYLNVPQRSLPEKYRDYFSPVEIDAIVAELRANPKMTDYWLKHVPRNLAEIKQSANSQGSQNKSHAIRVG